MLELNPSLVSPILEMLLGGAGKSSPAIQRAITAIEQKRLDGLVRMILHRLRETRKGGSVVDFTRNPSKPNRSCSPCGRPMRQWSWRAWGVRIGASGGMMNIAMPSVVIKMKRQEFDQPWSLPKTHASEAEQARIFRLVRDSSAQAGGTSGRAHAYRGRPIGMEEGHLLVFDDPVDRPLASSRRTKPVSCAPRRYAPEKRACLMEQVQPKARQPASNVEPPAGEPGKTG